VGYFQKDNDKDKQDGDVGLWELERGIHTIHDNSYNLNLQLGLHELVELLKLHIEKEGIVCFHYNS